MEKEKLMLQKKKGVTERAKHLGGWKSMGFSAIVKGLPFRQKME